MNRRDMGLQLYQEDCVGEEIASEMWNRNPQLSDEENDNLMFVVSTLEVVKAMKQLSFSCVAVEVLKFGATEVEKGQKLPKISANTISQLKSFRKTGTVKFKMVLKWARH